MPSLNRRPCRAAPRLHMGTDLTRTQQSALTAQGLAMISPAWTLHTQNSGSNGPAEIRGLRSSWSRIRRRRFPFGSLPGSLILLLLVVSGAQAASPTVTFTNSPPTITDKQNGEPFQFITLGDTDGDNV